MDASLSQQHIADQLSWWYQNPRRHRNAKIMQLQQVVQDWLEECFGYHCVEFSMLNFRQDWFPVKNIQKKFLFGVRSPAVMADFESLPVESESADFVRVIHVLEFIQNPHQFLREVDRILIPEGKLLIVSLNPWGWQGIQKVFWVNRQLAPWCGNFYTLYRIKDWLSVLGFDLDQIEHSMLRCFYKGELSQHLGPVIQMLPLFCSLSVFCAHKRVSSVEPVGQSWRRPAFLKKGIAQPSSRGGMFNVRQNNTRLY